MLVTEKHPLPPLKEEFVMIRLYNKYLLALSFLKYLLNWNEQPALLALEKKGTLVAALEELSSKGLVEVSIARKLGLYKGCGRFLAA